MHRRPTRARPVLMAGGVLAVAALIASTLSATAASTGPIPGAHVPVTIKAVDAG